jgi:hypothetical protein
VLINNNIFNRIEQMRLPISVVNRRGSDASTDIGADVDLSRLRTQAYLEELQKSNKPTPKPELIYAMSHADENLGDNFEYTPWLPPSGNIVYSIPLLRGSLQTHMRGTKCTFYKTFSRTSSRV